MPGHRRNRRAVKTTHRQVGGMAIKTSHLLLWALLTLFSTAGGADEAPCPDGWHLYRARCFTFYPVWGTWSSAESYCSQRGGNLASLHNPVEQLFVQELVRRHTHRPVWIGGYTLTQEGEWLWSDGSAFGYSSWPNQKATQAGEGGACMEMNPAAGGLNDAPCAELRFYVCSRRFSSTQGAYPKTERAQERVRLRDGVSVYNLLLQTSETVADEALHTAFLRGLDTATLPAEHYAAYCLQEALYLGRLAQMLEDLSRNVRCSPDIKQFIQDTHTHYLIAHAQYQNTHTLYQKSTNLSSPQPSPAVRQALQSFHDVVKEEPIYWVVALLPRAWLRPHLAERIVMRARIPSASVSPSPALRMYLQWWSESLQDQSDTYRVLLERYQGQMDISKAINIFRGHMIDEKALLSSAWRFSEDEDQVEPLTYIDVL